ncbi:MAG TPA: pilus assembly protein TadG-related protein [Anaerolineales bacterium]
MNEAPHERGQALILIVFAIVGLVAITGLAVDGGMAYSDRRNAQNAADAAALAAALGHIRGRDITATALNTAAAEGYNNNNTTNNVTVSVANLPFGTCPNTTIGVDITVQITSVVSTAFAPVVGIRQLTNLVRATSRSCNSFVGPLFNGNAIVALDPHGVGFQARGTPNWLVTGGGIFSNSSDGTSADCKGAAGVTAPSLTTVGGINMACHTVAIGTTTMGAPQLTPADYQGLLPPVPSCNGTAWLKDGTWEPEAGANGSRVAFSGDMTFTDGLYCVTNSPGPYHGQIIGHNVTFFLMPTNFNIKFNGSGSNLTATAPGPGLDPLHPYIYAGVLMFSAPVISGGVLQNTQSIDLRGNGTGDISGSIIVPSASVTLFGNSSAAALRTQVIGYNVNSGGTADINLSYTAANGYQTNLPAWITLLR